MLELTFSSKLDWGSYIISIAKTASKKTGALIHSMMFLSPEVNLYLYISSIWPCREYCCHIWSGALVATLTCRTVVPSLPTSDESLAHHQNVASLRLFYWY